ncbi:O-antigen ligase family protein [Aquimarina algiphila]|uniref:O-antigen ligase family protein n=1 Tax=Aquimarina algiphila TaxID=2047982 RepID=UPI00232FC7AB|nr:O-antigen ligase family protein [Aquimarina algiphila]
MNKVIYFVKNNIGQTLILFIAAMIPFKINVGNLAIIIAFIFALYLGVSKKLNKQNFKHIGFYFPLAFFLITVISGLTSRNIHEGVRGIDKNLLLVLIPFVLFAIKRNNDALKQTLIVFSFSTLLATIILIVYGLIRILGGESLEVFFFHEFSILFDLHAVYYAICLAISAFTITHYYLVDSSVKEKKFWLIVISLFILLLGIFLTASKAVIIVFSILYSIHLISFLKKGKARIAILSFLLLVGISVINIPLLKNRFVEGLEFNIANFKPTNKLSEIKVFNNNDKNEISDLELRYIFISIGLYHLVQDNEIFFGYGQGDIQDKLDYYYMTYGLAPNWYEGYNVHNQYLHILICYGIFTLAFFLSYLVYSFYYAIKFKSLLHLFFLITICFVFIFEVALVRNKGLILFYFFNTLFLLNYSNFENSNIRDKRGAK